MSISWAELILTVIAVIMIPLLAFMVRATARWARAEERLTRVAGDLEAIVRDKDRAHQELYTAMREDRAATDKRLRWLEEHLWNRGVGK